MSTQMRDEDGANAVEFALILPILVLLLFGAITFGLAFNQKQQMEHANREGVRFAATLPNPGTDAWFDAVYERIVLTAAGQAPITDNGLTVCVSVGDSSVVSRTRQGNAAYASIGDFSGNDGANGASPCVASTSDSTVQVTIDRDARLDAVFFSRPVTLQTDGVARYEVEDN